jgi:RNA polymerase sigma-70 factor (ECF subfamily)
MSASSPNIPALVDSLYRTESRRVFATLVRVLGDFDRAEEATQQAFAAAVEQWPAAGVPANPVAWLVSAGRFDAVDALRRRKRLENFGPELAARREEQASQEADLEQIEDDRLRLIFTCCHPALAAELQVALTLREVCDLTTEEIAAAFLTTPTAIAQRLVRGKQKIRVAGIPYVVPSRGELAERLEAVLAVIYLVFTEGYAASSGESLTRTDLSAEAIRLGRLLAELLPDAEVLGLLALMLLHDSRRAARTTASGDVVLLEEQDRSLWNGGQIAEAAELVERATRSEEVGAYTLQAAIALVHGRARAAAETDWAEIVVLYDLLLRAAPSPVVDLNRAVALAMAYRPEAGLEIIEPLAAGPLKDFHLAHAARADLCRRLGRTAEARDSYNRALSLAKQAPERRFLQRRLGELG